MYYHKHRYKCGLFEESFDFIAVIFIESHTQIVQQYHDTFR